MLKITSNAKDVVHDIRTIRKRLKQNQKKTLAFVANQGKNIAVQLAPMKRGGIRKGIITRVLKDKEKKISKIDKTFPYHMWVNATPPFATLTYKHTSNQPFFRVPQTVAYGVGGISPSGNQINWTGIRGYFDETAIILKGRYGELFDIEVKKALKVR